VLQRLLTLLRTEPAAIGTLLGSLLPALVLIGVMQVDEKTIAGSIVAVNALVGFLVRLTVSPVSATASQT
jgi:hypothetical protein